MSDLGILSVAIIVAATVLGGSLGMAQLCSSLTITYAETREQDPYGFIYVGLLEIFMIFGGLAAYLIASN